MDDRAWTAAGLTPAQQALWDEARGKKTVATAGLMAYFRELAEFYGPVAVVAEFGVRSATSTIGWLASGAAVHSYDLYVAPQHVEIHQRVREAWPETWFFKPANTLDVMIPPCDVLFIDDLHNYAHVRRELELHAPLVRSAIVFHDTTTLGTYGQPQYDPKTKMAIGTRKKADAPDPSIPGVRLAIDWMLTTGKWNLARSVWSHNGCMTLVRDGASFPENLRGVYL